MDDSRENIVVDWDAYMTNNMRIVIVVLVSIMPIIGCTRPRTNQAKSENDHKPPVFMLWEKYGDMHRRVKGLPYMQKDRAEEVFEPRLTSAGKVRAELGFARDPSDSHLNPDLRVTSVTFYFDRDLPLRDALSAIDEARALCAGGCSITGYKKDYDVDVMVTPDNVTQEQKDTARQIIIKSNSDLIPTTESMRASAGRFVPMIRVFYRKIADGSVDLEKSPIEGLTLAIYDPHQRPLSRQKITHLSSWTPKG